MPVKIFLRVALGAGMACSLFAQDSLPEGEGKALVAKVCSACHDLSTATGEKHTEVEWKNVVDSMASRGAEATDAELETIIKYLAKNFPSKK